MAEGKGAKGKKISSLSITITLAWDYTDLSFVALEMQIGNRYMQPDKEWTSLLNKVFVT